MRNPLLKRLPRELLHEGGKYAVIFLFLAGMISFVSGFLVASDSMIAAYNESFERYRIEDGKAEALEFYIDKESRVTGTPIAGLKLRSNLTICSINRKGRLLLPTGADSLQVGDYVIVVTTNPGMNDITDILQA